MTGSGGRTTGVWAAESRSRKRPGGPPRPPTGPKAEGLTKHVGAERTAREGGPAPPADARACWAEGGTPEYHTGNHTECQRGARNKGPPAPSRFQPVASGGAGGSGALVVVGGPPVPGAPTPAPRGPPPSGPGSLLSAARPQSGFSDSPIFLLSLSGGGEARSLPAGHRTTPAHCSERLCGGRRNGVALHQAGGRGFDTVRQSPRESGGRFFRVSSGS